MRGILLINREGAEARRKMANRNLTNEELEGVFAPLLKEVREKLENLSNGEESLLWALRRKLSKELTYDERGKPAHRKKLKEKKRFEQNNICPVCNKELPLKYAILDRIEAMRGYTEDNTKLIHPECDRKSQERKNYK